MTEDHPGKLAQLKRQTERLVKDVGIEKSCQLTSRSRATLRRYYSQSAANDRYYMPIDEVLLLEGYASRPYVTEFFAEAHDLDVSESANDKGSESVNAEVMKLAEQFGTLMYDYSRAMEDNIITADEKEQLNQDAGDLQEILRKLRVSLNLDTSDKDQTET